MNELDPKLVKRFFAKVKTLEDCHVWTGASNGYGRFNIGKRYIEYAHIVAWRIAHGEWPKLFVCHRCDFSLCVNPEHLFLGTPKDNAQDASSKNRMGRPHSLDWPTREAIRSLCQSGIPQRHIAEMYGTTQTTVSEINRGLHEFSGRKQDPIWDPSITRES